MVKTILFTATILLFGSAEPVSAQGKQISSNSPKADLKFLDDISIEVPPAQVPDQTTVASAKPVNLETKTYRKDETILSPAEIERAKTIQFKYALLLDTEVELLKNMNLLQIIDEWMGVRYRLGGTNKAGVDCSALMQTFFTALYGISLPRTAKEQYNLSRKVSRTDLREGDLVFFNTTGGISHVGMYLQNNRFIHASSAGVTISDLFDDYWMRRFIGVGRIDEISTSSVLVSKL